MADANSSDPIAQLNIPAPLPRMAPELALQVSQAKSQLQAKNLGEYQDETVVEAELPKTAQKGRYRLRRMWSAPKNLAFKAVDFAGDSFVKTQVIARILQSEVDHSKIDDAESVALTPANYKFGYKGVDELYGKLVHVFQVKPRAKRVGLFKGRIYIDVYTGALRRSEGKLVKSPSFFVKNIQFVQDYAEINGFNFPVHLHTTATAKIIGPTVVDITHSEYQVRRMAEVTMQQSPAVKAVSYSSNQR